MAQPGKPAQGTIFVISEYSQPGRANQESYSFVVRIDGHKAGSVRPQGSWAFPISPGRHDVKVQLLWFSSKTLAVDVPAGGRAVIKTDICKRFKFLHGLFWPFSALVLEPAEQG